jgi:F-type H+-transporting ATPase subunit b
MLNSLSSNYLSLEKTGGLFDIDATLPVLLIQFFLLVFLLKAILFEPLQTILKTRNELIQVNLKKARLILESVNSIDIKTKRYFK